jgi:acetylornithine deacetylase/succinyl-diaminopimelate desuccinylase-like protein
MNKQELIQSLHRRVSADRLRDLTLDLVRIPSPTGEAVEVSEFYAGVVRQLGLGVDILRDYPRSPSTVARWGKKAKAPTLTLDGHLDTIHAAHVPPYVENGRVYGRGSGDMKSGVAAMVEATRVLVESGVTLGGNLILATHSLHEAPLGHMEGLKALIKRGDVFVDAAIIAEGAFDALQVRGKGQMLFEIDVTRPGEVMHENTARPQGIPNPLEHAARIAGRFMAKHDELAAHDEPLLGPETFFLGQIHGGDFYNRVPTQAFVNGNHRVWPGKTRADVERTFQTLLADVPHHPDIQVAIRLLSNGLGYAVSPEARIVTSLRGAYQSIVGRELPLVGALSVCDVNVIVPEAGIPAVAHGTGSTTAHADLEWVEIANCVRTTQVFLSTIVDYLGVEGA